MTLMDFIPRYIELYKSGELQERIKEVEKYLDYCSACPHTCNAERINNKLGLCLSGYLPIVSSYTAHYGEEPGLSGTKGAGNIFFGNCNLRCIFCQNFEISQNNKEERQHEVSIERLANIMIELQDRKCHNIGLVSPTHFAPQILKAIFYAIEMGLNIPIIYNSNGYDSVEVLKFFDGVVDIYLPDMKYGNNEYAKKYSNAENYFDYAKLAIKEMYRQVGDKLIVEDSLIMRGLVIRHLVLPNDLSDTENVFKFIAEELSTDIYISLMSQYYPANKAHNEILLDRTIRKSEYEKALALLEKYGLKNGWIQEMESSDNYRPEFIKDRTKPFN